MWRHDCTVMDSILAFIVCVRIHLLHGDKPSAAPVDANEGRVDIGLEFDAFTVVERGLFPYEDCAYAVGVRGYVGEVVVTADKFHAIFARIVGCNVVFVAVVRVFQVVDVVAVGWVCAVRIALSGIAVRKAIACFGCICRRHRSDGGVGGNCDGAGAQDRKEGGDWKLHDDG